jgi:serine protease Do/serine protease DegQ
MASTLCVLTVVGAAGISRQTPEGRPRPTLTVSLPPDQEVGIIVQDVTPPIASAFSLKEDHGAVVTALDIGTLQAGDVILSVNGQNVSSRRSLEMALAGISPSDALLFQVSRNGETREIVIQRPGSPATSEAQSIPAAIAPGFRGVQIDGLGVGLSQYNGINVIKVDKGTPAEAAGLALGDIIVDVNQLPVSSVEEFFGYIEKLSGQRLNLGVMRQGIYIVVIVPSFY